MRVDVAGLSVGDFEVIAGFRCIGDCYLVKLLDFDVELVFICYVEVCSDFVS